MSKPQRRLFLHLRDEIGESSTKAQQILNHAILAYHSGMPAEKVLETYFNLDESYLPDLKELF